MVSVRFPWGIEGIHTFAGLARWIDKVLLEPTLLFEYLQNCCVRRSCCCHVRDLS